MLNKMEFNQMIGERLSTAIETMNMTQQQVILKCAERGYEISQSNASKMFSGSSIQTLSRNTIIKINKLFLMPEILRSGAIGESMQSIFIQQKTKSTFTRGSLNWMRILRHINVWLILALKQVNWMKQDVK